MDEVPGKLHDVANDRDVLLAEAERQMNEVEEAIGRLNRAVDDMRSRDQRLRAIKAA